MAKDIREKAQAILRAIKGARADLHGSHPSKKRIAAARSRFSAYTDGAVPLSAHVRDVYNQKTLAGMKAALDTLERLARAFTEEDKKLRPDVNQTAFRIMGEATGQVPKTVPPGERSDDEKDPEAVKRGKKGGKARAENLTPDEREAAAQAAALARWKKSD